MKKKAFILSLIMFLGLVCTVNASDVKERYTVIDEKKYWITINGADDWFEERNECTGYAALIGTNDWFKTDQATCHPQNALINGKMYVPLRDFVNAVGIDLKVDNKNGSVEVISATRPAQRVQVGDYMYMKIEAPRNVGAIVRDQNGNALVFSHRDFPVTVYIEGREYFDIVPVPMTPDIEDVSFDVELKMTP